MSTSRASKYFRLLIKHWSTILAIISVTGFLVSYELHMPLEHLYLYIFIGANAVIWMLVEIKASIHAETTPISYPNMRAAREHIIGRLKESLTRRRAGEIKIIGGRIRTISDILRELVSEIQSENITARNTVFKVYCMDPEYVLAELKTASIRDIASVTVRYKGYCDLIKQFSEELHNYNQLTELIRSNVTFEVRCYRSIPWMYAFLIDHTDLFWGGFTWNPKSEDFEGPTNRCFYLSENSDEFSSYYGWIENRIAIFDMTGARNLGPDNTQSGEIQRKDLISR